MTRPWAVLHEAYSRNARKRAEKIGEQYCDRVGLTKRFLEKADGELKVRFADQSFIHKLLLETKPRVVLEFGSGFSTITMACAAQEISEKYHPCTVHFVETAENWLNNTIAKLPDDLQGYVTPHLSEAKVQCLSGQLCHAYEKLPDVVPGFVYVDGPDPADVLGSHKGLSFGSGGDVNRKPLGADALYYETTMRPGCVVLVDGRHMNVEFLKSNLKRKWRHRRNNAYDNDVFVLAR